MPTPRTQEDIFDYQIKQAIREWADSVYDNAEDAISGLRNHKEARASLAEYLYDRADQYAGIEEMVTEALAA